MAAHRHTRKSFEDDPEFLAEVNHRYHSMSNVYKRRRNHWLKVRYPFHVGINIVLGGLLFLGIDRFFPGLISDFFLVPLFLGHAFVSFTSPIALMSIDISKPSFDDCYFHVRRMWIIERA